MTAIRTRKLRFRCCWNCRAWSWRARPGPGRYSPYLSEADNGRFSIPAPIQDQCGCVGCSGEPLGVARGTVSPVRVSSNKLVPEEEGMSAPSRSGGAFKTQWGDLSMNRFAAGLEQVLESLHTSPRTRCAPAVLAKCSEAPCTAHRSGRTAEPFGAPKGSEGDRSR